METRELNGEVCIICMYVFMCLYRLGLGLGLGLVVVGGTGSVVIYMSRRHLWLRGAGGEEEWEEPPI